MPFHIVISENHLRADSVKIVTMLLQKSENILDLSKISICLENQNKDFNAIVSEHNNSNRYFSKINEIALNSQTVKAFNKNIISNIEINAYFENMAVQDKLKAIMYSTFGFERQAAYKELYDYAKKEGIEIQGIDDVDRAKYSLPAALLTARNQRMANNLQELEQRDRSTITIVGRNHFFEQNTQSLYDLLNSGNKKHHFFLIMSTQAFTNFSYLSQLLVEDLNTEQTGIKNIYSQMNSKNQSAEIISVTDINTSVESLRKAISNNKNTSFSHLISEVGSLITASGDAHNELISRINSALNNPKAMEAYKNFLDLLKEKKYGAALRTACSSCMVGVSGKEAFILIKILLNYKEILFDINEKNQDGSTAIHYAASCENQELYTFLEKEGANPKLPDNNDRTAAEILQKCKILQEDKVTSKK